MTVPSATGVPAAVPSITGGASAATARRGTLAGLAATVTWMALGAESILRPGSMHYRDLLWMVPWTLTMLTFAYVHAVQRGHGGRLESWSFRVVMASMVLVLAGNTGVLLDVGALKALGFPAGALIWLAAMVPFGVATVRSGVLPRHVGVALALLEPGSILTGVLLSPVAGLHDRGAYTGGLEKGLVTAVVAAALWRLASERRRGDRHDDRRVVTAG